MLAAESASSILVFSNKKLRAVATSWRQVGSMMRCEWTVRTTDDGSFPFRL
jgi:hypothetical protein